MAYKHFNFLSIFFLLLLALFAIANAKKDKNTSVFDFIKELQGSHKGNKSEGIHLLKAYLHEFGYLNQTEPNGEVFDDALEFSLKIYQRNFHLKPTGILDLDTISTMIVPRCGVADIINGTNYMQPNSKAHAHGPSPNFLHIVSHYTFFPGNPRWPPSKKQLSYKFLSGFPTGFEDPVRWAFQKWAAATQYFTFVQVSINNFSDLTVGFYQGAHGDSSAFDGPGGVLAHAYSPTNGRFHYDADERWSVGPTPYYFDLETVAVHEIGHLLGLGHSQVRDAIMYPSIAAGTTKNIQADDIQGIRALYNY